MESSSDLTGDAARSGIVCNACEELWSIWESEAGGVAPVQPAHRDSLTKAGGMSAQE